MEEFVFTKNDNNYTYEDEKGVYTFTDTGDYMTAGRDPCNNAPTIWFLSEFNGKNGVTISGLPDRDTRTYLRILINNNRPIFYRNGIRDTSVTASPEAIQLANWFIEASNVLIPKLNEYIKNHQDQDQHQIAS